MRISTNTSLSVTLGVEHVVALSSTNVVNQWGPWQFPAIDHLPDGRLHVWFSSGLDSAVDYGKEAHFVSGDGGQTWQRTERQHGGLRLPTGERIEKAVVESIQPPPPNLPKPAGQTADYGVTYEIYPATELPASLQTYKFYRLPKGGGEWKLEDAVVTGPHDLPRCVTEGVFPIPWFDNLRIGPDRLLYAVRYGYRKGPRDRVYGQVTSPWLIAAVFYRSDDAGRTWQVQGEIPYAGDPAADSLYDKRAGFSEPGFEFLPDGSLLCFLRTHDGNGSGPMYAARSTDAGRTWSKPAVFYPYGVWPQVARLASGVVVLSFGRPGVDLLFSAEVHGQVWEHHIHVPEVSGTCSYTGLLATAPDRCLLVYSRWPFKNAESGACKAIILREITVTRLPAVTY